MGPCGTLGYILNHLLMLTAPSQHPVLLVPSKGTQLLDSQAPGGSRVPALCLHRPILTISIGSHLKKMCESFSARRNATSHNPRALGGRVPVVVFLLALCVSSDANGSHHPARTFLPLRASCVYITLILTLPVNIML